MKSVRVVTGDQNGTSNKNVYVRGYIGVILFLFAYYNNICKTERKKHDNKNVLKNTIYIYNMMTRNDFQVVHPGVVFTKTSFYNTFFFLRE